MTDVYKQYPPDLKLKDQLEAKQHLFLALDQMGPHMPKTHEELIERLRQYFDDQKVEPFSRMIVNLGEAEFRDFIADVAIESELYMRNEEGQIIPVSQ